MMIRTVKDNSLTLGLVMAAGLAMAVASPALAQPANNSCVSGAQLLTVPTLGSTSINANNVNASTDGTEACATSSSDVWYRVIAPANGALTASTCSSATFNTVVSIRTSCPGLGMTLACDNDGCGAGSTRSTATAPVTAGVPYYIRVASSGFQSGSTQGLFTLTLTHGPTPPPPPSPQPLLGPDVVVNQITDVARWGTDPTGLITAYSVGTDSCNPGDYPVLWVDSNNYLPDFDVTQHPVISQNLFRLKNYGGYSRFEQLGQSWLKHGFVSTNSPGCGTCLPSNIWRPSLQALQNVGGDVLGVNCSDTYGASLNGSQGTLGPKNIVNATIGTSPFIRGTGTGDNTTRARLQVPTADVAAQPAGTRFYVDALYIAADDAQFVRPGQTVAINALNNSSWRELTLTSINATPTFAGATRQREPGILAWKAADAAVSVSIVDHDDTPNPGTGWRDGFGNPSFPNTFIRSRYWVAAKATDIGGGLFRYEYVVYNHNSDRSSNAFSVPMPAAATVTDITFRAPKWHSGEPYANTAWTNARSGDVLTFSTDGFATTPNANALRWGNSFNFGFTSNVAPVTGGATIGLFKPGTVTGAPAALIAAGLPVPSVPCTAATAGTITGPTGTVCAGQPVALSVGGSAGTAPLGYQWRKNTVPVSGANAATLNIAAASASDAGSYDVIVSNSCGTATAAATTLSIASACSVADVAHSGTCPDGTVDGSDFIAFVNSFSNGDIAIDAIADIDRDGSIDGNDFIAFINAFSVGC